MISAQNTTVSEEEECRVMCFVLGPWNCSAYAYEEVGMDCQLYLYDMNTTDTMTM